MGAACVCMENEEKTSKSHPKNTSGTLQQINSNSKNDEENGEKKSNFTDAECDEQARFKCQTCQPPFIAKKNTVSFFAADCTQKTQYISKYFTKDLDTNQIEVQDVKSDYDVNGIDLQNCVYTFNPKDNKIYFICNNKSLMTLDLTKNSTEALDKEITTSSDNVAQIECSNGKIYILMAESITNNEDNDDIIAVPCSQEIDQKKNKPIIQKFGANARVFKVKMDQNSNDDFIFMMGGRQDQNVVDKDDEKRKVSLPHDEIFIAKCDEETGECGYVQWNDQKCKEGAKVYHTPYPFDKFGVINYQNKYLFVFGGVELEVKTKKQLFCQEIRVLVLTGDCEYDLEYGEWYKTNIKLPKQGKKNRNGKNYNFQYYHALYDEEAEIIHLFNYYGKHWKMETNQLFTALKKAKDAHMHPWTEQGKTTIPTRSKSIENIGPAEDSEVDEMLRSLGDEYEKFVNRIHINDCKDMIDEENYEYLIEIVGNKKQVDVMIAKAKEIKKRNDEAKQEKAKNKKKGSV